MFLRYSIFIEAGQLLFGKEGGAYHNPGILERVWYALHKLKVYSQRSSRSSAREPIERHPGQHCHVSVYYT